MGRVYAGIHEPLALRLRNVMGLTTLVETGTYKGNTVRWAMDKFEQVISIEITPEFYKEVKKSIVAENVKLVNGDTRLILPDVCQELKRTPTLFWLDAHWTGEKEHFDPLGHCPILEELKAINENMVGLHAIMIDDYAFWIAHQYDAVAALLNEKDRWIRVVDDVVIATPGDTQL